MVFTSVKPVFFSTVHTAVCVRHCTMIIWQLHVHPSVVYYWLVELVLCLCHPHIVEFYPLLCYHSSRGGNTLNVAPISLSNLLHVCFNAVKAMKSNNPHFHGFTFSVLCFIWKGPYSIPFPSTHMRGIPHMGISYLTLVLPSQIGVIHIVCEPFKPHILINSVIARPHPLTRNGVWYTLSNFWGLLTQRFWFLACQSDLPHVIM